MRIIRDYQYVNEDDRGASAAIGNFDGVHIGHQSVIDLAREAGGEAPLGIVTFEPHPRQFFAPGSDPFRLTSAETRAHRLEKLGVERLYELPFNATLSALTPEEFARDVIVEGLGLKHVVIGADFCFGKGRAGTAEDLQNFGKDMGFGVTIAPLLKGGDEQVSSTAIRKALPFLTKADTARIIVIDPPQHGPERSDPGGMLAQMLARHGVKCEIDVLSKTMPRVSDILNRHATDTAADMIVMGAYGHSRFREAILGGATRNMLEKATVPVFMAH